MDLSHSFGQSAEGNIRGTGEGLGLDLEWLVCWLSSGPPPFPHRAPRDLPLSDFPPLLPPTPLPHPRATGSHTSLLALIRKLWGTWGARRGQLELHPHLGEGQGAPRGSWVGWSRPVVWTQCREVVKLDGQGEQQGEMLLGLVLLLAGLPRPGAQVLETGLKCPKGKYPSGNNTFCCTKCHKELGQVEKLPCTPDRNTECGCQENQYRLGRDHTFRCRNCSLCLNGSILHQCVENRDAVCLCNPGFFLKENKCYPCHHCEDDPDCKKFCPNSSSPIQGLEPDNSAVLMPLVIFLSLCCFFLVLVGLAWHFQPLKSKLTYLAVKRMPPTPREPTGVQIVSTPPSLSPASAPALVPSDWPPERVGRPPWSIEEVPPHPPASAATLTPALVQALPNCLNVLRPDSECLTPRLAHVLGGRDGSPTGRGQGPPPARQLGSGPPFTPSRPRHVLYSSSSSSSLLPLAPRPGGAVRGGGRRPALALEGVHAASGPDGVRDRAPRAAERPLPTRGALQHADDLAPARAPQ
uniref:TNFR-Cys domain-containing protein n=1 Tax=Ornithorhynchus anatinus TaxID=9258 RepID=A0A6I8P8D9_ORNAN